MRRIYLTIAALALVICQAGTAWSVSTLPPTPPSPVIPQGDCPEPDEPPIPPGSTADVQSTSQTCPATSPVVDGCGGGCAPGPNPDDHCQGEDAAYQFNNNDAPDSLPSVGERLYLRAVFGSQGPLYKWGRHVGFGPMGRLNYLAKAQLTRDRMYVRVCNPIDNSTAAFEQVGDSLNYELVEGVGYPAGSRVELEEEVGGVPQKLVLRHPDGSSITMEFETDTVTGPEMDGYVYRVVERRTRERYATRIAYFPDRVVLTDASGHDYVCRLEDDRIVEISFTVDNQTRRWRYEYFRDGSLPVTEVNMQTGKRMRTESNNRRTVSAVVIQGADGKQRTSTYSTNLWYNRGLSRPISRAQSTYNREEYKETSGENKGSRIFTEFGLVSRTNGLGKTVLFERNNQRRVTKKTDELGNVWLYDYDADGKPLREVDPTGRTVEYGYDATGNMVLRRIKLSSSEWAEYRYEYDSRRLVTRETGPGGAEKRFVYNSIGRPAYIVQRIDSSRWSAVAYEYNAMGQSVRETPAYEIADPAHPETGKPAVATVRAYDAWGNLVGVTDPAGNATAYEYSAGNKLIAVVDPLGHRTEYGYDGLGQLTSQKDALGNRTEWVYGDNGKVVEIKGTAASGGCSSCAMAAGSGGRPGKYVWSAGLLLQSFTDLEGRTTRYEYDAARRKSKEIDPLGKATLYEYDAAGRLAKVTDPLGNAVRMTYDAAGRLLATIDPLGNVSGNEYDLAERLVRTYDVAGGERILARDAAGRTTSTRFRVDAATWRESRNSYNFRGDLIETVDAYGSPEALVTRFEHDADGRVVRTTVDPSGLAIVAESVYDAAGRLAGRMDPNGASTTFAYDAAGNLASTTSPEGRAVAFEYDAVNRRVATLADPDGLAVGSFVTYDAGGRVASESDGVVVQSYQYDRDGLRTKVTVPGRRDTELAYDAAGRLVEARRQNETGTLVLSARREYDAAGRLAKAIDELGKATLHEYDAAGRLTKTTDPAGVATRFEYDAAGRRSRVAFAHGGERKYHYNLAGELVRTEGGPEGTVEYRYDARGRRTEVVDANGRSRKTVYDAVGRVVRSENEMGQAVAYAYDAAGNRLSLTDANGNATRYEYDRDGNVTKTTYPAVAGQPANVETYRYDAAGRLACKVTPNGDSLRYRYDPAGNVAAVYHGAFVPEGTAIPASQLLVRYERDGAGSVVKEEDSLAALLFSYDAFGRLVEAKDGGLNKAVRYGYDARSLRDRLEVVDYASSSIGSISMSVAYGYDAAGRLASVKRDAEPASSFEYDLAGRRRRITLPNGVSTEYAYGVNDRLDALTTVRGTSTLAQFAYTHDATGNRTGIEYADGSKSVYEFDNAYRLTRDKRLGAANAVLYDEAYTYDSVGNRLTKTRTGWNPASVNYVYNARNQLVSSSGSESKTYSYDANGNSIGIASASGNEAMQYDVLNRLVRYAGPGGVEEIAYRGGAYHRWKVSEQATGASDPVVTSFLYDGDDVVADYTGATPALSRLYVTPGLDQNLSMTVVGGPDAGTYYYSQDGLGSVRTLTDSAGLVKNSYDYTAFGEPYAQSVSLAQRYAYTGRELRPVTGDSMHYRYRNYSTGTGRFDRRDPVGYSGGVNLYAYVNNQPHLFIDPYGLWWGDTHRKLTRDAFRSVCKGTPGAGANAARIAERNVEQDGGVWDGVMWIFLGSDSERKGARHYLVAENLVRSILNQIRMGLMEYNSGELYWQRYRWAVSTNLEIYKTKVRIKELAEQLIVEDRDNALKALANGDKEAAWEYYGAMLHTIQDRYSHTDISLLPLLDSEHAIDVDNINRNTQRYQEALEASIKEAQKIKDDACAKGVNICE